MPEIKILLHIRKIAFGLNGTVYPKQVLNERDMNGRHTIISTNLNPEKMGAMYEERVVSRMMDCRITTAIEFYGRDLRLMKG